MRQFCQTHALQEVLTLIGLEMLDNPVVAPHGIVLGAEHKQVVVGLLVEGRPDHLHLETHLHETAPHHPDALVDKRDEALTLPTSLRGLDEWCLVETGVNMDVAVAVRGKTVDESL